MLLSEISFASFLTYSVRGEEPVARDSRNWLRALKNEQAVATPKRPMSQLVAERLAANLDELPFAQIFRSGAVLVPVPSSRLQKAGSLWVPYLLARAMHHLRLARAVEPLLERTTALPKSAWSPANERPTAERHYETLRARTSMFPLSEVVLIDDVVTRGATFIGAASRVREALPNAKITCFAASRAESDPGSFVGIRDPRVGRIEIVRSELRRASVEVCAHVTSKSKSDDGTPEPTACPRHATHAVRASVDLFRCECASHLRRRKR